MVSRDKVRLCSCWHSRNWHDHQQWRGLWFEYEIGVCSDFERYSWYAFLSTKPQTGNASEHAQDWIRTEYWMQLWVWFKSTMNAIETNTTQIFQPNWGSCKSGHRMRDACDAFILARFKEDHIWVPMCHNCCSVIIFMYLIFCVSLPAYNMYWCGWWLHQHPSNILAHWEFSEASSCVSCPTREQ